MSEIVRVSTKKPEGNRENHVSKIQKICPSQSISSPVEQILFLQRTIGNQAVVKLIKSGALQAKLRIGQPGDIYEQEADRVADAVMRMPSPQAVSSNTSRIQRACPGCKEDELRRELKEEEGEEKLQARGASSQTPQVTPDVENSINSMRGGGQPLPELVRAFYEPRFGHDFSQVRVHTDAKAAEAARVVNPRAFTVRKDIVFGAGEYAPEHLVGQRFLAHELTHVMHQAKKSLYRQQARSPSVQEWNRLPPDARDVLEYSFITRKKGEWIWQNHPSATDCFIKNLSSEYRRAFENVYYTLIRQGLWLWVERVSDIYTRNVQGIKFKPDNRDDLTERLSSSTRFCRDTWIGGAREDSPKWREMVTTGSPGLHIIVPRSGLCSAHIDTIAPIERREPRGECNYSVRHGTRHIIRDLWGW